MSCATYDTALRSELPRGREEKCEHMLTSYWVTQANYSLSARMLWQPIIAEMNMFSFGSWVSWEHTQRQLLQLVCGVVTY